MPHATAFAPGLALLRRSHAARPLSRHQRLPSRGCPPNPARHAIPRAMTSTPDTIRDGQPTTHDEDAQPKPPKPSKPRVPALPVPAAVTSTPLLSALYDIFSGRASADNALAKVLSPSVEWDTPFVTLSSCTAAADLLNSFMAFAIDPALCVHSLSIDANSGLLRFTWTLSFTYPLPWRPRVAVSGVSEATLEDGMVVRVADEWAVPPSSLVVQAMPTLTDFVWLWPSPHAESDRGSRRVVKRGKGYSVVEVAARPEYRIRQTLQKDQQLGIWATPALPEEAFEGNLRRKEQYATVTPISMRQVGEDEFEWATLLPGAMFGSSELLAPVPACDIARFVEVGERRWAVTRFRGYSKLDVVQSRLKGMVDELVADGVINDAAEITPDRVWIRLYDAKLGFNSKGLMSMSMYASTFGLPRLNELAVELDREDT